MVHKLRPLQIPLPARPLTTFTTPGPEKTGFLVAQLRILEYWVKVYSQILLQHIKFGIQRHTFNYTCYVYAGVMQYTQAALLTGQPWSRDVEPPSRHKPIVWDGKEAPRSAFQDSLGYVCT